MCSTSNAMGDVLGLPYRILVVCIGLAVTTLSVTGVVIWMRKQPARIVGPAGALVRKGR